MKPMWGMSARKLAWLVAGAFETTLHPGFLSTDTLVKCFYLNGLDPVYFKRCLHRLAEDQPAATLAKATDLYQAFSLDAGPSSRAGLSEFVGKALVAPSVSVASLPLSASKKSSSGKLGPYPGAPFCSHCWGNGFGLERNKHLLEQCPYCRRSLQAALSARLVVSSVVPPALPASAALVPPDDALFVAQYERQYAA